METTEVLNYTESRQPIEFSWRYGKNTQDTILIKAKSIEELQSRLADFLTSVLSLIEKQMEIKE